MAKPEKKQAKAFRLTEETAEKFKEIAQDMGANQQQALARLIEVYEAEMGKESFPEMREDIDTFEGYIRAAGNMYLQALESVQNMRALVRTEYDAQLKSKDKSIADLQERIELAEKVAIEVSDKEGDYQVQIIGLKEEINVLQKTLTAEREDFKEKSEESKREYRELSNSYAKLQMSEAETKNVLSGFMKDNQELKNENSHLAEEKRTFDMKMHDLVRRNEILESDMEREKERAEEEAKRQEERFAEYKKSIQTEHRLELQLKINELQSSHKGELDEVRKELDKYKDLYYQSVNSKE